MSNPSPEQWKKIRAVFESAIELPVSERAAFLAGACGDDRELLAEVESLLAIYKDDDDLVNRVVGEAAQSVTESMRTGTMIGPYRILEPIGEGGMGSVYLAERQDETFEMRVALKVVRGGLDSRRLRERFHEERRILAALDHPNIARVLDGGSTPDDLPYFVMEYVEGERIDHYCERQELSVREKVVLFRTICDAVDHAHRQLIVHRDIKPANILVTRDGQAKLLDFGIAKLLEAGGGAGRGVTMTGMAPMTPDYASPEQIRGEPVTTATDVHALGIVLYELMTARHPFRGEVTTAREVEDALLESDPDSPSAVVSSRRSAPQIAGDLDNIILKALAKEPTRRYPSAAELSADLERYLLGHPVAARPSTFLYRAGKFVRRNAIGVSIAGLVAATILTASVISTAAYLRAERSLVEAKLQRDRLEDVNDFLAAMFEAASPKKTQSPETITARELLDAGAERVEEELADRPDIAATIQAEIGRRYFDLSLFDKAEELQRAAVAKFRAIDGISSPEGAKALIYLAGTLIDLDRLDEAEPLLRECAEISSGYEGDQYVYQIESSMRLAEIQKIRGENAEAAERYEKALVALSHEPVASSPEFKTWRSSVPSDYGLLLERMGRYEEAEAMMRRAIEIATRESGEEHSTVGSHCTSLAFILGRAGKHEERVRFASRALAIQEKALGEDQIEVAFARQNLADALVATGEFDEAEDLYAKVHASYKSAYGDRHHHVGTLLNNVANSLLGREKPGRALPKFREAAAIYADAFGPDHQYTAIANHNVSRSLHALGKLAEAEESCRANLATRRKLSRTGTHPDVARSLILLGTILRDQGDEGDEVEAEKHFREALRIAENELSEGHPLRMQAAELLQGH